MKCETAQDYIVLMSYGELPDEFGVALEQHLGECEACRTEVDSLEDLMRVLDVHTVLEPSPNLLAQSRMRLDDALDATPEHGWLSRLRGNAFRWMGTVQGAPALATLLAGVGFLAGNFTYRYQVSHAPKLPATVTMSNSTQGAIANVSGIEQTPNSELVQVHYNRVVPETMEGSLDDPSIRQLLLIGAKAGASSGVRVDSVSLLASECASGHRCDGSDNGQGLRNALLVSLRYDKDAGVRLKALEGLKRYVDQDQRVRDGVSEALMHDGSSSVRKRAIDVLEPVQSDSSVRQVLRTVSTQDDNPYIRTASFQALQGAADIQ